ncbi:glycosyltransferase family 4 protein [Novacetimonas cocois]|nr:glycosyltransferase family 1 protein [Novacetimonas cocois]
MKFPLGGRNAALLQAARAEKKAGRWSKAAELYQDYLSKAGRNARTFRHIVQLGNCLKDAGHYDEALAAYNDAEKIDNKNSDLYLQRGHLFKLMQNFPASAYAYQKAYNLDPSNHHAKEEIEHSGALAVVQAPLSEQNQVVRTIWLDVADFLIYAQHNTSMSGIQRVIANLVLYLRDFTAAGWRVVPVAPEYDQDRILSVKTNDMIDLINVYDSVDCNHETILKSVQKAYDGRTRVWPAAGDVLCMAGAFWILPNYDGVMRLKQKGIMFCPFIHDLLQIREPEYVQRAATDKFQIQMSDASELSDFILTNSEYVASDVRTYIKETKLTERPVNAVVLPTELKMTTSDVHIDDEKIKFVVNHDYVLCVSTIEIRKNHKLLISVWEKLREEMGDKAPFLVLIGKWGWQIDEFHQYIEEKGYIDDWLFIFNGIPDVEMEYLYKHCMFTVYPSFAEGFGLPIGESLVYGKPCIASDTTSMPEVGGKFVRYIDPFDAEGAYPIIRKPIVDRQDLKQWEDEIKKDFRPKRWSDFCSEFYNAIAKEADSIKSDVTSAFVYLPPEYLIEGGDHDILIRAAEEKPIVTFRSARIVNWHPNENWGCWSSSRRSEIAFRTDLSEGEKAEVFLRFHRTPYNAANPFVVIDGGDGIQNAPLTEHPTFYRVIARVQKGGVIHLKLLARGYFPAAHGREIFIAWSGLAYCRYDDPGALTATLNALLPIAKEK